MYGRVIPARSAAVSQTVIREPIGPVLAITPWNFPINQAVRKIAAALAAGCSIIVKGPSETPGSPAELVRAFADAGLPPGVVSYICGPSGLISDHLIRHPVIRKLSFTGSTTVGKQLAALAGSEMKRVSMELGGHAPVLVFADADIERTTTQMVAAKFRNAGQVCVAPTRFIVHDSVYESFLSSFTIKTERIVVGSGLNHGTTMGPLINRRRLDTIEELVSDAVAQGARLMMGGKRISNEGFFYAPTVLADVTSNMRAMNEEPFGPLALVMKVRSVDDALAEANRLKYGLASYAYTTDATTIARLAADIQAGMLSINHYGLALPETPFGGIKDSGFGSEGGIEALEAYTHPKFISLAA